MSYPAASLPQDEQGTRLPAKLLRGADLLQLFWPPVDDRRFWAIQALVVMVAGLHYAAEVQRYTLGNISIPVIGPVSLFFIPVLYAALNFGLSGSVATALWCSLLSIPNLTVMHLGLNQVPGAYQEALQLVLLDGLAVFVGRRVDRERRARQRAELATAALTISEQRYRGLFNSSPAAVLVLDPKGEVLEANRAAGALFRSNPRSLVGTNLSDLLGQSVAQDLLNGSPRSPSRHPGITLRYPEGTAAYLEPSLNWLKGDEGQDLVQLVLRDTTAERQRQAGLRAYASYVLRAQEEERKRIAQELHDDTVQTLVLLCRQLDIAENSPGAPPRPVAERMERARQAAEEVVIKLRDFARVLRPPTLDDLGVAASLRRVLAEVASTTGIETHMHVEGEERRPAPEVELGLFRIGQEAIRNVERHAQATTLTVELSFTRDRVILEVRDDGVGFVIPSGLHDYVSSRHLGVLGMQERARLLGGSLEIHSAPGEGTRVVASIPTVPPSELLELSEVSPRRAE